MSPDSTQTPFVAATFRGVKVPHSPYLHESRIRRIEAGRYEGDEIRGALATVGPQDRVLEMGAGLGLVGAVIARNAQPEAILSFEANPHLIEHIEALYKLNGLTDRISVRHQVVMSAPNPPPRVTFHVMRSFLGSSLIERNNRSTVPVDVPTARFDAVVSEFRPTVLIMDIEGGELDFLAHADLRGIRAIVIEFHPEVYGRDGMRASKAALERVGFEKQPDLSTRQVWTCTRTDAQIGLSDAEPDPAGGWSEQISTVRGAVIQPYTEPQLSSPSGVQTAQGMDVPMAAHWRAARRMTLPFVKPIQTEALAGRWLWGGVLYRTFSHFVAESAGRLWALSADIPPCDGIAFIERRVRKAEPLFDYQSDFFAAMGVEIPVRIIDRPARVEELIVPGQGFGLGDLAAGTERFRAHVATRFAQDIAADGAAKLYISRARLPDGKGRLLGEAVIEDHLRAEGYDIFYPELADLNTQIARYRAARQIIACDGSALHMLAFCSDPDQQIAMIRRRKSSASNQIARHLASFSGRAPAVIDCLRTEWRRNDTPRKRLALGQPDMGRLHQMLLGHGMISGTAPWPELDEDEIRAQLGTHYAAYPAGA